MSDIVEKLKAPGYVAFSSGVDDWDLLLEAADEIKRLRAALEKMGSLDDQAECCGNGVYAHPGNPPECCDQPLYGLDRAKAIARAALEEKP